MDRQNSVVVVVYRFVRRQRETMGWTPNWEKYVWWLKERKRKRKKAELAKRAAEDRRNHNDKVLRQYGLGKYQRKGDW